MADGLYRSPSAEMRRVHEEVSLHGYSVTNERNLGLPEKCGWDLLESYFNSGELRRDKGDFPPDRKRARDVVLYEWHDDELILSEYETIAIRDRSGIKGERIHKRIKLLQDSLARNLIETFLRLVPAEQRQNKGTFGINLFRTHTDVVSKPHRDDEEFILLYVLDRVGEGAESYLYEDKPEAGSPAKPVLYRQLNPGELMIFEDRRFKHGAEPIIPPLDGKAKRDVLICTVDYPTTYLQPSTAS